MYFIILPFMIIWAEVHHTMPTAISLMQVCTWLGPVGVGNVMCDDECGYLQDKQKV